MRGVYIAATTLILSLTTVGDSFANLSPSDAGLLIVKNHIDRNSAPFFKGKLGIARAMGYPNLPDSISYAPDIGARNFCGSINFDSLTSRPRYNHAIGNTFASSGLLVPDSASQTWLNSLVSSLQQHRLQIFLGLVGAPKPYQQPLIRKPAAHPAPTHILAAANLTARWINHQFLPGKYPINWVIWNEPEHTLRGINSSAAAMEMAEIYRAYYAALSKLSTRLDGFGLASFMKGSLRDVSDIPSRFFAGLVLEQLPPPLRSGTDYITFNSYHGGTLGLITRLQTDLKSLAMDQPLVLNQFVPELIGSHPSQAGTVQAASQYLASLDRFINTPDLSVSCMSFWAGPDRKALLRDHNDGSFSPSLPFHALSFYQTMPLWRLTTNRSDVSPYQIFAARDQSRLQVIVFPRPELLTSGIASGVKGKPERKLRRQQLRRLDRSRRKGKSQFVPVPELTTNRSDLMSVSLQLPIGADQAVRVQRLKDGYSSPVAENLTTDHFSRLKLQVSLDELVLLTAGTNQPAPPLRSMLRTDLYIHRDAPRLGWASIDPIRDGFVLALPSFDAVAHASASYSSLSSEPSLALQVNTPDGLDGIASALQCTAIVLKSVVDDQPLIAASWGNPSVVRRIHSSRAFSMLRGSSTTVRSWPKVDAVGRLQLNLPARAGALGHSQLHLAAEGCKPGTQLQVRVLQ